ncbi:LacI family DNA-binding transcriptional regulator [Acidipropionibacterium timonense]|uniref:LacI family DNA-binding transcriptional regulator n=1 Tax=Acidipropionibacterium timonense TaxID=2161818 RepID=UPI0010324472|nr:LacI family DNA-binding transcriptional regulator [Acidipropionibacterium timonense]
MQRPTIKDIAKETGVSAGAVSFALNDKPGVSEETRARIKAVAKGMGWSPNVAAVALSGNRAGAVGIVIARDDQSFAGEGFFMRLIAGMEERLTPRSMALVLQLVRSAEEELEVHRRWWAQRRVDGVVLVDPAVDDPRWQLFEELGMPAVVVGADPSTPLPGVHIDDGAAVESIIEHLAERGHQRVARVGGGAGLTHSSVREAAFRRACRRRGMTVASVPVTDASEDAGGRETTSLLRSSQPPTAILYDNEVLALGGLIAIRARGLSVPDDVAVVSFEDAAMCRVLSPALTALSRDPSVLGAHAVDMLLARIEGRPCADVVEEPPVLVVRGSTASHR